MNGAKNHTLQLQAKLPFHHIGQLTGDSFEMLGSTMPRNITDKLVGLPVTCDGKVVGKIHSVLKDEVQIFVDKEHHSYVADKLKGSKR